MARKARIQEPGHPPRAQGPSEPRQSFGEGRSAELAQRLWKLLCLDQRRLDRVVHGTALDRANFDEERLDIAVGEGTMEDAPVGPVFLAGLVQMIGYATGFP